MHSQEANNYLIHGIPDASLPAQIAAHLRRHLLIKISQTKISRPFSRRAPPLNIATLSRKN